MTPSQTQAAQKARQAFQEGRYAAAVKIARSALKTAPQHSFFANLAGLATVQLGDPQGAAPYFATAMRANPDMVEARSNLAQALIQSGTADKALAVVDKGLEKWPDHPTLLFLRASAAHALGDPALTISAATNALLTSPANGALFNLRALAHADVGDTAQADADFRSAVAHAPTDADPRQNYAAFLAYHGRPDDAFAQIDVGLQAHPAHPGLLLRKASLLQATGDFTAARVAYDTLLGHQPDHALALNGLAYVVPDQDATAVQNRIDKALRGPKLRRDEKVLLGFAQAHLAAVAGQKDADKALAKANAAAAKAMPYDALRDQTDQQALMAAFVNNAFHSNPKTEQPVPIFITGLIRSGTTLAEQVLASHAAVQGFGELTQARLLADGQARAHAATQARFDGPSFAERYRAGLPPVANGVTHFVDKMPDNFRVIGALLAAFPNATVIEMRRDPRDIALSMWRSFFPTTALAFANDFSAMADHMNLYARTMATWHALFPGQIHRLEYEALASDLDNVSRHMADICGLDWSDAMRHPERTGNVVLTASDRQIRAPVHTSSIGKWREQRALLAPLMAGLDPNLWPGLDQD